MSFSQYLVGNIVANAFLLPLVQPIAIMVEDIATVSLINEEKVNRKCNSCQDQEEEEEKKIFDRKVASYNVYNILEEQMAHIYQTYPTNPTYLFLIILFVPIQSIVCHKNDFVSRM
jgi:hypothetical protein